MSAVLRYCQRLMDRRPPDFTIGTAGDPYLERWFITPWRRWFCDAGGKPRPNLNRLQRAGYRLAQLLPNVYLHKFHRSDDDRALHDHPWPWASWLLDGAYTEHTITQGGIQRAPLIRTGSFRMHRPRFAHRIALRRRMGFELPVITLFFTGPRVREWGFHCPERGWVHWRQFTTPDGAGIGAGCD